VPTRRGSAAPADAEALAGAARGGRVAHTGFLEPSDADALVAALRAADVSVAVDGGVSAARRRVVVAFPEHVPKATVAMSAVYFEGVEDADALRAAARTAGVDAAQLGDAVRHQDGTSLITLAPPPAALLTLGRVGDREVAPLQVPVERVSGGSERELEVVVPSLRVDVLGGKAFRVSRSYFAKGVGAGRVRVNGKRADKGATAGPGDEVYAEGLGRFKVVSVAGQTRRGNLRVTLHAERA
jgi:RNA-binding protein YlmH